MGAACQSTYWPANEAVAAADEDGANPGSSEVVEALGPNGRGSGSVWVWWGVEQRELGSIGRLEKRDPFVEVSATDRCAVPGWLRVPGLDAPPEFVHRHIEEMQFDTDTKATSCGSHLVAFDPHRDPKVEDDTEAQTQDLLSELPQLMVHLLLGRRGPRGGAESPEPFIFREAHGAPVCG